MSFAPRLVDSIHDKIPSVVHFDKTARPQTVRKSDDAWLHNLLQLVQNRTGYPILINTSFNTRGKPILNRLSEALDLLADLKDLDYVLVEDWLVGKEKGQEWRRVKAELAEEAIKPAS